MPVEWGGIHTSCEEENILGYPGTSYFGENILVHEWSHNVMSALGVADPELYKQIEMAYEPHKIKGFIKINMRLILLPNIGQRAANGGFGPIMNFMTEVFGIKAPMI